MSDKTSVVDIDRVLQFEKECMNYKQSLEDIDRKLILAVRQVSESWRDRDFSKVLKHIGAIKTDMSLSKNTVDEQLMPFLSQKRELLLAKRSGR